MFSPLVRRRRLGAVLRTLRRESKLSTTLICKKSGINSAKISRMENATFAPNIADLMNLLKVYGVDGHDWHEIMRLANEASERGWWMDFAQDMGARQRVNADLEWGAARIREYSGGFVPGLLQTAAYTRSRCLVSRIRGDFGPTTNIEKSVDARMARQRMLRRPGGSEYVAVIDELALRRPAADPDIMMDQINELIQLQTHDPQITLRVLPIRATIADHWLPNSSFSMYDYADPSDPDMTLVEGEAQDLLLCETEEVSPYRDLFLRIEDAALEPDESTQVMRQITLGL